MSDLRTFPSLSCFGRASLSLAAFLSFGPDALACSCEGRTFASRYETSANVFTAVITDQYIESADEYPPVLSSFVVTETFKGEQPFQVLESIENGSCAIDLEVGVEYLFLVPDSGHVHLCSGTLRTEQAEGEIAAIKSFVSGEDEALVEPWHFGSYDYGCSLMTLFEIGEGYSLGVLGFDVSRRAEAMQLHIHVAAERDPGPLTITVGETSFVGTPRGQINPYFVILGEVTERVLRQSATSDSLQIHFDKQGLGSDLNVEVSTTNLRQAGTVAKALECSGPR